MYIRYDGEVETKSNGQKKIGGSRPAFSKIEMQVVYTSGIFYRPPVGREFKPNQYAIWLDFDNKEEWEQQARTGIGWRAGHGPVLRTTATHAIWWNVLHILC